MGFEESHSDYEKLGEKLRSFIKGFSLKSSREKLELEMRAILELAEKIGEPIVNDARLLKNEFGKFRGDFQNSDQLLKQALKLEQETREI